MAIPNLKPYEYVMATTIVCAFALSITGVCCVVMHMIGVI